MSIITLEYVEAPPVTPLPYGLLSVAQVVDHGPDDTHWQLAGVQWEPYACTPVQDTEGACQVVSPELVVATPDSDTVQVYVNDGNAAPGVWTVDFGGGDGVETYDEGDITDGITHNYAAPGTYTVTVAGPNGYTATASVPTAGGDVTMTSSRNFLTSDGVGTEEAANPFLIYSDVTCRLRDDLETRARAALLLRSGFAVERVLADRFSAAAVAGATHGFSGGPFHPVDAVGMLEEYLAVNYGGIGVIHMGRRVATSLLTHGTVVRGSGRLETGLGTYVAAGAGYDRLRGASTPAADTAVLYATGAVRVDRDMQPFVTPPLMSRYAGSSAEATNDIQVRAQAVHTVGWECVTATVLVNLPYAEPVPA